MGDAMRGSERAETCAGSDYFCDLFQNRKPRWKTVGDIFFLFFLKTKDGKERWEIVGVALILLVNRDVQA
jgi:hypothetical protein